MPEPSSKLLHPLRRCLADIASRRAGAAVAVAVSGGPDSVALAGLAVPLAIELGLQPRLWHVHHGLLPMADGWTAQVERLAASLGVPCRVRRVEVPAALRAEQGLEAAARTARRRAFAALARADDCRHLLLAQHLDDQAETVLMRLLRGAGFDGMAGMRPHAVWEQASIEAWRPWLSVARHEILPAAQALAAAHGITLADDPSNLDPSLARGLLRASVLPALATHWPGYRQTLARHADQAAEVADWLAQQAAGDLVALQDDGRRLDVAAWRALVPGIRRRLVLRAWLAGQGLGMPSAARLAEFERQLLTAAADRGLRWRHAGTIFGVYRGYCQRLPPALEGVPADLRRAWQSEAAWDCAPLGTLSFRTTKSGLDPAWLAAQPLRLSWRAEGGRLRLAWGGPARGLKAWFQERGVPPWERERLPRLWRDGQLIWVAGLGEQADLPRTEPGIGLGWQPWPAGNNPAASGVEGR
ncbi:MAG: tRNA lysidine(34) synthetase TilS [Pigmentiphaga sp.]|nr:tRNA lysidine(34) synthetase TilS [Pigmentiphaga sp.]